MFKLFLDKSDQRKMELFRYLENKPLLSENREKILDELCISEFLLNKTIEELSIDFSAYGLADDFQLFIEGNNVVLIESGRGTSLLLEDYLIRNSLGFSMLTEIFFETFDSVNEKHRVINAGTDTPHSLYYDSRAFFLDLGVDVLETPQAA